VGQPVSRRDQTPLEPTWFLRRRGYAVFMARELTSLFVGGYLVFLLVWLARLGGGPEAFAAMMQATRHPTSVIPHTIVLAAAIYHSITWFNLSPKVSPVFVGEHRAPDALVAVAMGYGPWAAISGLVLWGLMR